MIYSRSAEYAIRAFVYLAEVPEDEYAMVKNIAADSDIPAHFLAKILQQLARKGFLQSSKGPTGGFRLNRSAEDISLLQLVDSTDGLSGYERCLCGLAECGDDKACGMHDSWVRLRSSIMEYLGETSIADVLSSLQHKRRELAKQSRKQRSSKKKKKKK